jgi:hypothetical protein
MSLKNAGVVALSLVLGAALSTLWRGGGRGETRRPAAAVDEEAPGAAREAGLGRDQFRALLREELARLAAAPPMAAPEVAPREAVQREPERERDEDAPRTDAQLAVQAEAKQIVATRLAAGVWRREDERRWWEMAGNMNRADHEALRLEIIKAQNAGQMQTEPGAFRFAGGPAEPAPATNDKP